MSEPSPPASREDRQSTGARVFRVEGLDCAEEIAALRRTVGPLVGGDRVLQFDLLAGHMVVGSEAAAVADREITEAAARAGLRAAPLSSGVEPARSGRGREIATLTSAAALVSGVVIHALATGPAVALGLAAGGARPLSATVAYLAAVVAGGAYVAPRAWFAARALRPDMNLLMTLAVLGAIGLGELLEAAMVSFLFAAALLLESWSVGRARRAVQALLSLSPPLARVLDAGVERMVAPDRVEPGQVVVVHGGERLPLDGLVVAGTALMDTSPVTGESRPTEVGPGDEVFAGTISTDGALEVRVTRPAADTVLARIVRRVAEAGRRRAPVERWVDSFARVYTPAVLGGALLLALLPPLAGGAWGEWFYRALVLLVIGCPCALVISTPVSVVAALAAAARNGVLIKGADVLERPARVTAIAFDKTGTLTTGRLRVVEVRPGDGTGESRLLEVAAALERRSSHPIAAAVLEAAAERSLEPATATGVRTLPGRGVEGLLDGVPVWLGSPRLASERAPEQQGLDETLDSAATAGRTVVFVGAGETVLGLLALADVARDEAASALTALAEQQVSRIALVTGDNAATAAALARSIGIAEVHAGLLPEDKVEVIERMRTGAGLVAFVGDGINDAPALAAADLGIATGEAASEAAVETADVALVGSDLRRVPWLIAHSRRTLRVIKANIAFALAVKAAFVIATLAGHASLWAAIAADMGASLLVIFNSLRLLSSTSGAAPEAGSLTR